MKNSKKKINIIDLIALIILGIVILFTLASGVYKIVGSNADKAAEQREKAVKAKIVYTVEVSNKEAAIMKYLKAGDKVYEANSFVELGTVLDVIQTPYKMVTEDNVNKQLVMTEIPGKINLDIEIEADAIRDKEYLQVNTANILVGKGLTLNIGDCYIAGTIVDIQDMSAEKEAQE